MNDNFIYEIKLAQSGDKAASERIIREFLPLILKYRYVGTRPDEDLLGELNLAAYRCVLQFRVDEKDMAQFMSEAIERKLLQSEPAE